MSFSLARVAAATAALSLVLAGCGQDADQAGSAASSTPSGSDGTVVLYSGRNEKLVQPILDAFTKETGIKVDVRYGQTAAMAAQMLEEGERTPADVFLAQDAGALGAVAKEGLTEPLPQEILDRAPQAYRDAEGRWVGVTGRARVFVYNPDKVPAQQIPASVHDLTKPEWKGRLGIAPTNASFQSFVTAMRVTEGEDATETYLRGLAANDPQIREKNGQIVADVDAGKIDAGLVNHYYLGELAAEKGVKPEQLNAKLHFFGSGDLGGLVNVSGAALTKGQQDEDGRRLVEYLLGDAAQKTFVTTTFEYPVVEGIEGPAGVPPLKTLQQPKVDLNDLDSLQESVEMIKQAGLS